MTTDIQALRALVDKMTPGEWQTNWGSHIYGPDPDRLLVGQCLYPLGDKSNDAAAIVALRNAAPGLLDEVERLRDLLVGSTERMEATLRAMDKYNEANGTAIIGPSLLGMGVQVADNRAALGEQL